MATTICHSCGDSVPVNAASQGTVIPCPSCGGALYVDEVTTQTRVSAATAEEIEGESRPCPMCGETLLVATQQCPSCGEILDDELSNAHEIYSDKNMLVMHRDAVLPDVCLKTNTRAEVTKTFKFSWHPWYYFMLCLGSPLLYVIVALIVRYTAKVELKFSRAYRNSLWMKMLITWAITIPTLVFGSQIVMSTLDPDSAALALVLLWVVGLIALILSAVDRSILPARISKHYVWLKGVSPKYLAALPEWSEPE